MKKNKKNQEIEPRSTSNDIISRATDIPNVMVSYAHDNKDHLDWVVKLSEEIIIRGGINVILDQWDLNFGDLLSMFMENLANMDKILIICSPLYKQKADTDPRGGVGLEKRILVDMLSRGDYQKIIPITYFPRETSIPLFLSDLFVAEIEFETYDQKLMEIIRNIYGKPRKAKPKVGLKPNFI